MISFHARPSVERGRPPGATGRPACLAAASVALALALLAGVARPAGAETAAGGTSPAPAATPAPQIAPSPPPAAEAPAPPAVTPPADLKDLGAWIAYRRDTHRIALTDEARLFYRRGLSADRAGDRREAVRLVRGAAELDPAFVAPHLTLAAWALPGDPSQALMQYAVVLDLARRSFPLQIELVANVAFLALHALFLGLLATSLVLVALRQAELRHIWHERIARHLNPGSARLWSWIILLLPFVAGFGIALPTVILLGMLWPLLRVRERAVFVALALALTAAPFSGQLFGRLATPLREDRAPLHGLAALPDEAWSPERQAAIARIAEAEPGNPFVQFALGWTARLGGDLATAEAAYRRALTQWPQDARTLNNLANVLVARGHTAPAIDLYRAAIAADPLNAAAPFNLSLLYTRQFEYRAATEAAARASALDFELVKTQQALGTEDGVLPTADQWIAPATLWATVRRPVDTGAAAAALPPAWYGRIETSSPWFAVVAFLLALASAVVGARWQQSIPLRPCRNCGRVVCRRCSQRRRELALCPACARQEAMAESPEFARVLLGRIRAQSERRARAVRTTLAILLPGFGLLALHRVFRAGAMLAAAALLAAPVLGVNAPFSYHPWPGLGAGAVSPTVLAAGWFLVYVNSILGYFAQAAVEARRQASPGDPVRGRVRSVDRVTAKAA